MRALIRIVFQIKVNCHTYVRTKVEVVECKVVNYAVAEIYFRIVECSVKRAVSKVNNTRTERNCGVVNVNYVVFARCAEICERIVEHKASVLERK